MVKETLFKILNKWFYQEKELFRDLSGQWYLFNKSIFGYHQKLGVRHNNKIVIPPNYIHINWDSTIGMFTVMTEFYQNGVYDSSGKLIVPVEYDVIKFKKHCIYCFSFKTTNTILYNYNGQIIIKIDNMDISDSNKFSTFTANDKTGVLNQSGEIVCKPTFDNITVFNDDTAIFFNDGKYSVYDLNIKKEIISSMYDKIINNINVFTVILNNRYGICDRRGIIILPCIYNNITISDNWLLTEDNSHYKLFNISGQFIYQMVSKSKPYIYYIEKCGFIISTNSVWGFINESGKVILDFVHNCIQYNGSNMLLSEWEGNVLKYEIQKDNTIKTL